MTLKVPAGEILCTKGEDTHDLFIVHSGKLLVFNNERTKITPIAYLGPGEYFGELSFFDKSARSAHVISIEKTTLIKVPVAEIERQMPTWLIIVALSITQKIRSATDALSRKGIRRMSAEGLRPLSIDEQRFFYHKLHTYLEDNDLN